MTQLRLTQLAADSAALLARFGPMAYLEFLAVSLGTTTLNALVAPQAFRAAVAGDGGGVLEALLDPFILIHEAIFALVFAAACLRIWWETEGGAPHGPSRARMLLGQALPLIVLNIIAGYAAYLGVLLFLVPGLIVSALTTTLVPAVVLEGRGWGGLARSVEMTRAHLWRLSVAWGAVVLPWLALTVSSAPAPQLASEDIGTLWLAWMVPDLFAAGLATVSLCLTMAAYRRLIHAESGGSDPGLHDIFR